MVVDSYHQEYQQQQQQQRSSTHRNTPSRRPSTLVTSSNNKRSNQSNNHNNSISSGRQKRLIPQQQHQSDESYHQQVEDIRHSSVTNNSAWLPSAVTSTSLPAGKVAPVIPLDLASSPPLTDIMPRQESTNIDNHHRRASQGPHHQQHPSQRVNKQLSAPMMIHHMDNNSENNTSSTSRSSTTGGMGGQGQAGVLPSQIESSLQHNNQSRVLPSQAEEWQTQFFKTKLCPYHVEGRCINGENCRFAHTPVEVRPLPDLHRTKLCESYVRKEPCTDRFCPFAHDPSELRTSSHSFYKVTLCNFYKKGRCWNGPHCRFAHGVSELQVAPASSPTAATSSSSQAQSTTNGKQQQANSQNRSNDGSSGKQQNSKPVGAQHQHNNQHMNGRRTSVNNNNDDGNNNNPQQQQSGSHDFAFSHQMSRESSASNHAMRSVASESDEAEQHRQQHNSRINYNNSLLQQQQQKNQQFMQHNNNSQQLWMEEHQQSSNSTTNPFSRVPQLSQLTQLNQAAYDPNDPRHHNNNVFASTAATERSARPSTSTSHQSRRRSLGAGGSHYYNNNSGHPHSQNSAVAMSAFLDMGVDESDHHHHHGNDLYHDPQSVRLMGNISQLPPHSMMNHHYHNQTSHGSDRLMQLHNNCNNTTTSTSRGISQFTDIDDIITTTQQQDAVDANSTTPTTTASNSTPTFMQQMTMESSSARGSSNLQHAVGLLSHNQSSAYEFAYHTPNGATSGQSSGEGDENHLQGLSQVEDVQSLTTALFTLLQQSQQASPTSSTSWSSTSARASPVSVPNEHTDLSMNSPAGESELLSSGNKMLSAADQWAFELLKTLETTVPNNNLQSEREINVKEAPTDGRLRLPPFGPPNSLSAKNFELPSAFHQQFMAFAAAVAASPTARSLQGKDDNTGTTTSPSFPNLFNLQALQSNQTLLQPNGNGSSLAWPPSLEALNSKPESLSVLPSLSNLVLSSFFGRSSEQKEGDGDTLEGNHERNIIETGVDSNKGDNDGEPLSASASSASSCETPMGLQSSMFTLSLDKLVGFVTNDEERGVSSTVSTGATTTAAHTPRRPADGHDSKDASLMNGERHANELNHHDDNSLLADNKSHNNEMPNLASQQLLQALQNITPSSSSSSSSSAATTSNLNNWTASREFTSPFGPFSNGNLASAADETSKLSVLFTHHQNDISTTPTFDESHQQVVQQRGGRDNYPLSFPSPGAAADGNSNANSNVHQSPSEMLAERLFDVTMDHPPRQASVPSPFPSLSHLEDATPANENGAMNLLSDSQWTPIPLVVPRRSSAPRLPTKLDNDAVNVNSEILQTHSVQQHVTH